jgi:hypothetical protein
MYLLADVRNEFPQSVKILYAPERIVDLQTSHGICQSLAPESAEQIVAKPSLIKEPTRAIQRVQAPERDDLVQRILEHSLDRVAG